MHDFSRLWKSVKRIRWKNIYEFLIHGLKTWHFNVRLDLKFELFTHTHTQYLYNTWNYKKISHIWRIFIVSHFSIENDTYLYQTQFIEWYKIGFSQVANGLWLINSSDLRTFGRFIFNESFWERENLWLRIKGRKGEICSPRVKEDVKRRNEFGRIMYSHPSRLLCQLPDTWKSRIRDIVCERRNYKLEQNASSSFFPQNHTWGITSVDVNRSIRLSYLGTGIPVCRSPCNNKQNKLVSRYLMYTKKKLSIACHGRCCDTVNESTRNKREFCQRE